jgi:hypothetical protein
MFSMCSTQDLPRLIRFRTILIIVSIASVSFSAAQSGFGIEAGLSSNFLHGVHLTESSAELGSGTGFSVNMMYRLQLSSLLSLKTEPGFLFKNYRINRTDSLAGIYTDYSNGYIQLPICLSFSFGHKPRVNIDLGFYFGYWISAGVKGTEANIFSVRDSSNGMGRVFETFDLSPYSEGHVFSGQTGGRFEFGWMPGISLEYPAGKKYSYSVSVRYLKTVTGYNLNETWGFSLGVIRNLNHKKGQ